MSRRFTAPRFKDSFKTHKYPTWRKVRRTIAALKDKNNSAIRARPILLLASTYGLRCSEIARLTLDDLDWHNEILTVQRAKRGNVQQFPLRYEIGEAIIKYLEVVRPRCNCRNLFVTLKTPYRSIESLAQTMRVVLSSHGLDDPPCGLHALRHACATELLRQGSSLRNIADFLGHRSIRSVSIYARLDARALHRVAEFNLKVIL